MRILHVTPYYERAWGYGGIPRVVGVLARAQVRAGHRVAVCTTDAQDASTRLAATPVGTSEDGGVEVHVFRNLSNRAAYRFQLFTPLRLSRWLGEHVAGFDVLHLHGCHHLLGAVASRACAARRVAYVLSPHGTGPLIERRRAAKWVFDATVGRGVLSRARKVLCVSEAERADLGRLGVADDRLCVVGNPLELEAFDPVPDGGAFRERHGLGQVPLVVFLGKITPRKAVGTLLEAFAGLSTPRARLVLAGNALGGEAELARRVRKLGLGERVTRVGQLEGPGRFEVLAAADVVAYPARHEVFGLVAFESLLCGTPVVVANDSGCGELVGALGGGLTVPPGDVAALTFALEKVLGAPEAYRAAAREAAQRVRVRFSPEAHAARVVAAYGGASG